MMDKHTVSSWRGAFYGVLCLTIVNVAFVVQILGIVQSARPTQVSYSYIGDDYPTELPYPIPPAALVFQPGEPHFALLADVDWAAAFPHNFGFTTVGPAHLNRTFQIAMQHQMHCLDVFRVGFAKGGPAGAGAEYAHHVEHCLRYMRQTVLCHADTTLEESEVGAHRGRPEHKSKQGYGTVHRCRDWTALRRYLAEHPPRPLGDELVEVEK